jgi:2',3'-cyclic-nucleotide 2'-phosphodiesterase (5'-nucleotidase family)
MKKYRICLLLFFVWACNEEKSPIEPDQSEKQIVILYTNDEHGWMEETTYSEGCAKMMGLWREQESYSEDGPFLILSGGDN